jgi:chromatin structure-remodeling complex subunit RSC9
MVAKDFITNVTSVFPGAVARVVYPDERDKTKVKYTMKGIAPRATPVDLRGRPYVRCQWKIPVALSTEDVDMTIGQVPRPRGPMHKDCDLYFSPSNVEEMWAHIVETHLEVPRDPDTPATKFKDGLLKGSGRRFACLWSGCGRYPEPGVENAYKVSMHVKIHLPDFGPGASARAKLSAAGLDGSDSRNGYGKRSRSESLTKPAKLERFYLNTALDEKGQATGLPLAGMLVLRNLARQMLKIDKTSPRQHLQEAKLGKAGTMTLVERHFGGHEEKLFHVMTYNYSLRAFAPEFLQYVSKGLLDREELVESMEKRLRIDPELEE